ncbi:glycosyltransferase family 4 protein [Streptomyces polyrhachis]|uniref:Glycosyltransferase family 4 protein n=1 Tax=Streptomyces polyrhachis TaxID=1282885 RepID=A0ABW2GF72_9ACTN
MRTIYQITPYYPPHLGGLERVVSHLAAQQAAAGHDVRVLTTDIGAGSAPRRDRGGPLRVRRHRAVEVAHTPLAPGLLGSLLRAPRGAVLHLHSAHAVLPELVALSALLKRRRFLLHFHLDVDASGRFGRLLPAYKKHVFGRVLRAAAGVIVLNAAQGDFVHRAYRVARERIHLVPNGVSSSYFRPVRPDPQHPLRLLYVGRLSVQKNVGRLLEAMSLLTRPVELRIVGDGELRPELEAQAARLGLAGVEFAGPLFGDELVRAYAEADAFVLASDKEGMPLVVLEAMAAALPVVATDVPGTRELLDGVGLLAAPDPAPLAAAVDRLAAEPGLRRELAGRSAAAARAYTWETVAAQVEKVYAEAGV